MSGWAFYRSTAAVTGASIAPAAGFGAGVVQVTTGPTAGAAAGLVTDADGLDLGSADAFHLHCRVALRSVTDIALFVAFGKLGTGFAGTVYDAAASATSFYAWAQDVGGTTTQAFLPDDPLLIADSFHEIDVLLVPGVYVDVCINGHRITLDTNVLAETVDVGALIIVSVPSTAGASILIDRSSVRALWGDYTNPKVDPRFRP